MTNSKATIDLHRLFNAVYMNGYEQGSGKPVAFETMIIAEAEKEAKTALLQLIKEARPDNGTIWAQESYFKGIDDYYNNLMELFK